MVKEVDGNELRETGPFRIEYSAHGAQMVQAGARCVTMRATRLASGPEIMLGFPVGGLMAAC